MIISIKGRTQDDKFWKYLAEDNYSNLKKYAEFVNVSLMFYVIKIYFNLRHNKLKFNAAIFKRIEIDFY